MEELGRARGEGGGGGEVIIVVFVGMEHESMMRRECHMMT